MKVLVFSGPSLAGCPEVREEFSEFIFLPPAGQADLVSAVEYYHPDIVGLIDDYSGHGEAPWHNEIQYVLNSGVKVFGAAGGGAVKAAELGNAGMSGIGAVYNYYASNLITADDEVVCLFDEKDNYRRLSEPFINIRFTVEGMKLPADLKNAILNSIKEIHWKVRTRDVVLAKLKEFKIVPGPGEFDLNFIDIQERDALALLQTVRWSVENCDESCCRRTVPDFDSCFRVMFERDRKVKNQVGEASLDEIAGHCLLHHPDSEDLVFNGLNREIMAFLAGYLGIEASLDDIDREFDRFRKRHNISDETELKRWLNDNDLNENSLAELMKRNARCRLLQRWFVGKRKYRRLTSLINEGLALSGEYKHYKDEAINLVKEVGREKIGEKLADTTLSELVAARMRRNDFPWNVHPFGGAAESGLSASQFQFLLAREEAMMDKIRGQLTGWFNLED